MQSLGRKKNTLEKLTQISQHISYLLLTCRNVSVEGLGSFRAFRQSASYDSEAGVFYPSHLRIQFSAKEDSDTLLAASLSRKLKVKINEAQDMIHYFVSEIHSRISRQHYCRLEGIGYLINNNGKLILKDMFWKNHASRSL